MTLPRSQSDPPPEREPLNTATAMWAAREHGIMAALNRRGAPGFVYMALVARLPNVSPSLSQLAEDAGPSRVTVMRALKLLERVGLVRREQRKGSGKYHNDTTVYHLADIRDPAVTGAVMKALGRCAGEPSCADEPRCEGEPRCAHDTDLGAPTNLKEERVREKKERSRSGGASKQATDPWTEASKHFTLGSPLDCDRFRTAWGEWAEHRQHLGKPLTPGAIKRQVLRCQAWGLDAALAAIDRAISSGWRDLYPPDPSRPAEGHGPAADVALTGPCTSADLLAAVWAGKIRQARPPGHDWLDLTPATAYGEAGLKADGAVLLAAADIPRSDYR